MSRSFETTYQTPPASASGNKALWAVVAVLGATVLVMGGYLMRGPTRPVESGAAAVPALVVSPTASVAATSTPNLVMTEKNPAPVVKPATVANKSTHNPTQTHLATTAPIAASRPVAQESHMQVPPPPVPKPVCLSCGTVTSVTPIQRDGTGSGTGAIAGGVLGGVLGNQVGGGDGKSIATLLGAIGGGFAGNAVEKKMKKVTVYQIELRMDDGSVRSFEQATPASVGAKVIVEGDSLRSAY
jgi:outer membrane lipoprotein SlyB